MKRSTVQSATGVLRSTNISFVLLTALATLLFCSGCQSNDGQVIQLHNPSEFNALIQGDQPVLVDFYKDGCPICVPLDPVFDQLAQDYSGRARIARFSIMTSYWTIPYWDFKQEHEIDTVPEVHLYYKGREVKRWTMMYMSQPYRNELDKLVPHATSAAASSQK